MTKSKEVKIIISVLVLIILILVGMIALMNVKNSVDNSFFFKMKKPTSSIDNQQSNSEVNQKENTESEMTLNKNEFDNKECLYGWQKYKQDVLGISFCYPKNKWGEVRLEPISPITDLGKLIQSDDYYRDNTKNNNGYYNIIDIKFSKNTGSSNLVRKMPTIRLMRNNSPVKQCADNNTRGGIIEGCNENISSLRQNKDICKYSINYKKKGTLRFVQKEEGVQELYNRCDGNIKIVLAELTDFFGSKDVKTGKLVGWRYTYFLNLFSYKDLQNGYFDNAIIYYPVDESLQLEHKIKGLTDFFSLEQNNSYTQKRAISKQEFIQAKEDFQKFVNSIKTYKPVKKDLKEFKSNINTNDRNIKLIENYYWLLTKKDFKGSYNLKKTEKSFDEFVKEYQNIYYATPYSFRDLGNGKYDFLVKYQDHNKPVQTFHVKIEVSNGKLKTNFVEEFKSKKVRSGDNVAYVTIRGNKTYVILEKDGHEIVVDEGKVKFDEGKAGDSEVKLFSNIKFSPKGNYLTYSVGVYEWGYGRIYNINKEKFARKKMGAKFEFTPDEKYLLYYSGIGSASFPVGIIYDVSDWKELYNVFGRSIGEEKYEKNNEYIGVDCRYDNNKKAVEFILTGSDSKGKELPVKKLEYQLP